MTGPKITEECTPAARAQEFRRQLDIVYFKLRAISDTDSKKEVKECLNSICTASYTARKIFTHMIEEGVLEDGQDTNSA